jgi:predicted TPR repeat methyltransferase
MLLLVLFVSYNPLLAPLLGRIITYRMLFRTTWLMELLAILLLARLLVLTIAALRLRSPAFVQHRRWLAPLLMFTPLLLAVPLLAPRIASGITLLHDAQSAAFTSAEADMLAYLRMLGEPGSIIWADPNLIDEIPPAVGHSYGPYFRYNALDPAYYTIIREFYTPAVDPQRLAVLAGYMPDYLIAGAGSAVDRQLGELPDAFTAVYRNEGLVLYAPTPLALTAEPFATLVNAARGYRASDRAQAEALARTVLESSAGNVTAGVLLAQSLVADGRTQEALEVAQRVVAGEQTAAWAQQLTAEIQRGRGEWAENAGDHAEAAAAYRAALAADPADMQSASELAALLGLAALDEQNRADKDAVVAPLQHAAAPYLWRTTQERSAAYHELGAAHERMGDLDAAENAYREGVAVTRPWDADARAGAVAALGRFLVRVGRPAAAQELYGPALKRYGAAAEIYHAAAELATLDGGREAAAVVYTGAAAANPLAAWPHIAMAQLYLDYSPSKSLAEDGEGATEDKALATAQAALQKAVAAEPSSELAYRLLSRVTRLRQDAEASLAVWQQAADANPQALWPRIELAQAAGSQGNHAAAVTALAQAAQLAPNDEQIAALLARAQEAAARQAALQGFWETLPERPADVSFMSLDLQSSNGWTLAGIYASSEVLPSGDATPLWIFWQSPSPELIGGSPEEGWQRVDDTLWMQATEASSLLYDGGFERSAQFGRVLGLPEDFYAADANTRQVHQVQREGKMTHVAALVNGLAAPNTSMVSPPLAVSQQLVYLYGGWLRSIGGNAYLGRQWLGHDGSSIAAAEYLPVGFESGPWQVAYQLLDPPPDASALQAQVLNVRTTGTALVDDLLLLPLDLPGMPTTAQAGEVR